MSKSTVISNDSLYTCDVCDESFYLLPNLNEHKIQHKNVGKNNTKKTKKTPNKKKKKKKNKYCKICCKTYSTVSSYSAHTKKYHYGSLPDACFPIFKKGPSFKTRLHAAFEEFEKSLPLELKTEPFKCHLCEYNKMNYKDNTLNLKHGKVNNHEYKSILPPLEFKNGQLKKYQKVPFKKHLPSTSVFKPNQFSCNYYMCVFVCKDLAKFSEHAKVHYPKIPKAIKIIKSEQYNYDCHVQNYIIPKNEYLEHMKFPNQTTSTITSVIKSERTSCDYDTCKFVSKNEILYSEYLELHGQTTSSVPSALKSECKPFKCDHLMCEFISEDETSYLDHYKTHQITNDDMFACVPNTSDMTQYDRRKILPEFHFKLLHGPNLAPYRFRCDLCTAFCDRPDHFEYNQWWNSVDYNLLVCKECALEFSDPNDLYWHDMNVHCNW